MTHGMRTPKSVSWETQQHRQEVLLQDFLWTALSKAANVSILHMQNIMHDTQFLQERRSVGKE